MKKLFVFFSVALLLLTYNLGFAEDITVTRDLVASLGQLPGLADSPDKGALVDLVKAIDEFYPGKITIGVYPQIRSVNNVVEGRADFHMPKMRSPLIPASQLPFRFISERTGVCAFVIYSNKDKIITPKMINDAVAQGGEFPYNIDVGMGSEGNYPFKAMPTTDFKQSLLKVQNKRIDALIWAMDEADLTIKTQKLSQIHRELWGNFDDVIIIAKGPGGDGLDKAISDCLRKLKASGRLQKLYSKVHAPYVKWQPADMGW